MVDSLSATSYPTTQYRHSDCWRGYNLLDVLGFKHFRINHSKLFAARKITSTGSTISGRRCPAGYVHIPDREAKRHMRKFNGVPKEHFGLFLKECEWRFNNPKP